VELKVLRGAAAMGVPARWAASSLAGRCGEQLLRLVQIDGISCVEREERPAMAVVNPQGSGVGHVTGISLGHFIHGHVPFSTKYSG
jgi:hypothetical protein